MKNNIIFLLGLLWVASFMISALYSGVAIPLSSWFDASSDTHFIATAIRLPRIIMCIGAGVCLALAGYLMQSATQNPMADPYLLGASSGAALSSVLWALLFPALVAFSPVAAAVGAAGVTILALILSGAGASSFTLILAGITLSSLCTAGMTALTYIWGGSNQLRSIVFWGIGSIEGVSLTQSLTTLFIAVSGLLFVVFTRHHWLLLASGATATHLSPAGTSRLRMTAVLTGAVLTAIPTAWCGPVGFVGLVIPHAVQAMGFRPAQQAWAMALCGSIFLLINDTLAHIILPGRVLPLGLLTSLSGLPMLLYILYKGQKNTLY